MKTYKVLSQKDKWFSGKFDPVLLEKALNDLAREGWRVVSMASASREGLLTGGGKDELIVLLEKETTPSRPQTERSAMREDGVYQL